MQISGSLLNDGEALSNRYGKGRQHFILKFSFVLSYYRCIIPINCFVITPSLFVSWKVYVDGFLQTFKIDFKKICRFQFLY